MAPENKAVIHGEKFITYRELLIKADALSKYLRKQDIPEGSRVAVLFENSIEYVIAFMAVTHAGFVTVPLDTSLKPDKLNFILENSETRLLLIQNKFLRHIKTILGESFPIKKVISERPLNLAELNIENAVLENILEASSPDS